MNRIDRLTAIIIFLQGRKRVTVEELSERYGISPRTVYRDLAALQEAGVPIGSEPGKGYFIVRGYHLPPVMFDRSEASSLLAGERLMQRWSDTDLSRSYISALDKIRAVLPPHDKEYFETLDQQIKAYSYPGEANRQADNRIFTFLQNALYKKEVIQIKYFSPYNEEKTTRNVEPLGLLIMGNHWYLAAWCRLREDYRLFRVDRFEDFKFTGDNLKGQSDHTLQKFYNQHLAEEKELHKVVVWFEKQMIRYIGDQKYWHGWAWEREIEGGTEMTFLCSHLEYFARWLLLWGNSVIVKKNEQVKKRVTELVMELYDHHQLETDPISAVSSK